MTIKTIAQANDLETYRSKLSKTNTQKKRIDSIKEGFLINNFVKDSINNNKFDIEGNFIIPPKQQINPKFEEPKGTFNKFMSNISGNAITPLCAISLGVLGSVALATKILHSTVKMNLKATKFDRLPDLPRNMNLNTEEAFVTYNAIQNPSIKTILGALATISFAGTIFVIKNFIDGCKEIWIKKREAKIQRDLQENLIEVETKSFAGKNNIIRNLMREKADEMKIIMGTSAPNSTSFSQLFKGFSFKGKKPSKEKNNDNSKYFYTLLGIGTVAIGIIFTKKTLSSIRAIGKEISNYNNKMHQNIDRILNNTPNATLSGEKDNLLNIFSVLNFKPEYVRGKLEQAGLAQNEIDSFISRLQERQRIFVNAPEALGGKRGIQYYSYIDDVQGHLYNWIMNKDNGAVGKFTKNLFFALATVAGLGYLGKSVVEAVKDVQVKKVNAQTDLSLHKNLVEVELKNFEAKKRSNINVLMTEFRKSAKNSNNKEKLQTMSTEILYEIKNGAPFVYS